MQIEELLNQARDLITVKRVFGEPSETDGIRGRPGAAVRGGGGGGSGDQGGGRTGTGGGMGLSARPVGVYRIKDGEVKWVPAVDATRIALLGQAVGVVALLVIRSISRSVARRHS
jgi:uncharacterized spore protein YtfJ